MSDILFKIITEKVFKDEEIQEVSLNSTGSIVESWTFDFKAEGLSRVFLREYATHFWKSFRHRFGNHIQIGGMETGAIGLVAGVLTYTPDDMSSTGFYIRKSRKKSNLANLVEGNIRSNIPIILVDDILNFGRTIRKQVVILEDLGYKVTAVFCCLRFRDMSHYQDLLDKGIVIVSIFELNDFEGILPVRNLVTKTRAVFPEKKYVPDYKVVLTNQPNAYLVVPKSAPLLVGGYIYMGVDGGFFYCLRAEDGSIVWVYRVFFGDRGKWILSSPAVFEDRVVFGAYDGNVYCLNRFTGKRFWAHTDADWVGSSPCIDAVRGIVYIGLAFGLPKKRGGVVALDIRTGQVKWKNYTMAGRVYASPAHSRKHALVVCGSDDGCMYAFHAKTGVVVWKFQTHDSIKGEATFYEEGGLVVFGSLDGGVYVLCIQDGSLYHRFEARFGFYSTPVMDGHRILIGSLDKNVYCFDIIKKKTSWVFETFGRIFSTPTLDGQSVFIGSNDGMMYELDAQTGRRIAGVQLAERIVNRVQVSRQSNGKNRVYIPTHMGELYSVREE